LTRLDISRNKLFHNDGAPAGKAISDMLAVNSTLRELDISGNAQFSDSKGGPSFAQALSVGITDNGAILSVNLLKNSIGVDQAKDLVIILKEHPTLKSLCGSNGNETELDMSGKMTHGHTHRRTKQSASKSSSGFPPFPSSSSWRTLGSPGQGGQPQHAA
jgi:hypothetical protein